jgi:DNA-binding transcriptional LysR family regulator
VLAVLPTLAAPMPGLQEQLLWHEPVFAVVPAEHRFADAGLLAPDVVVGEPLVLIGASRNAVPEIVDLFARHGVAARPTATADCPQTVAGLVRAGLGVGLLNGVAACAVASPCAGDGLVAVPLADLDPVRRVAAYWYEMLLATDLGRALHREVLTASPPPGALAPGSVAEPPAPRAGG